MQKTMLFGFVVILCLCIAGAIVFGQTGGDFTVSQSVISGGGGNSAGGDFIIDSTLGQTFAGESSTGGTFTVGSGFWTAVSAPATISGTITYGNGATNPFVSDVIIAGTGSPNVMTTTGVPGPTAGQYVLSGFGSSAYTVTPAKTGGVNGAISSFDAGRIALHVAGPPNPQLTSTQLIVADVSGNNAVTSFDAAMIAKFVAGPPYTPPGIGSTASWRFTPVNRAYASVTNNVTGEDYTALLMGEVSGNWSNTGVRPFDGWTLREGGWQSAVPLGSEGEDERIRVKAPQLAVVAGTETVISIAVENIAGKNIIAYEFELSYDPTVVQPHFNTVDLAATVSRNLTAVVNAEESGLLRVVVYGAEQIKQDGVLLNLRFRTVGVAGWQSPLTFDRIMFNEGDSQVALMNGRVEILTDPK